MAQQKRKMDMSGELDESERNMHYCFQNVANNLSQFYTQAINHQKLAFQAGQMYAFLRLHKWMFDKLQDGRMVTVTEILTYLKGELDGNESDDGPAGEGGASGSGQNEEAPEVAEPSSSAQAGQNQGSYFDMHMDFTSNGN